MLLLGGLSIWLLFGEPYVDLAVLAYGAGALVALTGSRRLPESSTVARSLHARGDKVYIDAVQNGAGRLLVAPLCVRPVPGARVSTPLRWSEVNARLDPGRYTIKTVPARLKRQKCDPMLPILDEVPDLLGALEKLSEIERSG